MQFKNPIKEYSFTVMLKNKFLTDIRIFKVSNYICIYVKIVVCIVPRPIKATLEMHVPFGDEIK